MNPKEVRELWVQALESGEYKQGVNELHPSTGRYCCLGVLADLAVKHGIVAEFDGRASDLADELEPVRDWAGLRTDDGMYGSFVSRFDSLAGDNDEGKSFETIAATIRSEPEGLLAKSMDESAK